MPNYNTGCLSSSCCIGSLIYSYLNRMQIVSVKDGISRGTVLGPLLFIFYMNEIGFCMQNCHISMFAANSRIFWGISGMFNT